MTHLARLALVPLSTLNALAGTMLMVIALFTPAVPAWVAAPAAAVVTQGLSTLAWLRDTLPLPRRISDVLFATGECAALVIGTTGIIAALIAQSATADPEYGPPTMLALVAVHGIVGLLALAHTTPTPAAP
jgi:hypothetical protein